MPGPGQSPQSQSFRTQFQQQETPNGLIIVFTAAPLIRTGAFATSIKGLLPGELEEGIVLRWGGAVFNFTPPRLRTVFDLASLLLTVPRLEFSLAPRTVESEANLTFGWIAQLIVDTVPVLIQEIEPAAIKMETKPVKQHFTYLEKQTQLLLPQPIRVSRASEITLKVAAFFRVGQLKGEFGAGASENEITGYAGSQMTAVLGYNQSMVGA